MNRDDVWRAIAAQRMSLTDMLEHLSDEEWRQPSLCAGWTVRDVVAHLTFAQISIPAAVVEMTRARGNLNRMIHDSACRRAARPIPRIIADIRGMVGSQRHAPGVTYRETLIDILVHGQDIAVPLGRRLAMRPDAAAVAATRVLSMGSPFYAKRKMQRFRLTATDIAWSVGDGMEVRGPMDALLLVLTGRLVAVKRLSGDGAAELAAQLTPSRT